MKVREHLWFWIWSYQLIFLDHVAGFPSIGAPSIIPKPVDRRPSRRRTACCLSSSPWSRRTNADAKTTLTEATTWKIRLVLNDKPTEKSKGEIFNLNGYFKEEEGYEPPQGTFHGRSTGGDPTKEAVLEVVKSRWLLSEDPEDRKDSLWIWGLFSEPLYPFMLLEISLVERDEDGNSTPWPPLYAQISHRRKDGSVLLEPADLKVRNVEQLNADPFGAAKVEIYGEATVGRITFQPIVA
jgi:hypothetical protein